ncbi:LCP family protein [Paenibacillus sp. Lou8.1]|uniref:LCP family protein n=1 Tax=Paenibacillus sp. Lou8.1 TaxID=2962041 RepID=UPI0020B8FC97|nr:LCP family protein [Paenibacillus sp. Lou8.1]MCP3808011.1 LCP family protein [Paenibacillus sp. Lou8.1]
MRKFLKWLGISVTAAVLLVGGYYTYSIYHFTNQISVASGQDSKFKPQAQTQTNVQPVEVSLPPEWDGTERVNILLLGGDSRGEDSGRSDSVMVASIDPVTKKATLMSILRDTYVNIPGHGQSRLNAAFSYGGPDLTRQTVSDLLGIPIQYYVYTDFNGFIALVDSVDGIDLDVEKDMHYTSKADKHQFDIDLKKGMQHMDGKTALQYVRFRHDATSDFTRTERQRKFITELGGKIQSTSSLIKLPSILNSISPYIETNLSTTEMLQLASLGFNIDATTVAKQQIPPNELVRGETIKGAQVLGVDERKLKRFIQNLFEQENKPVTTTVDAATTINDTP